MTFITRLDVEEQSPITLLYLQEVGHFQWYPRSNVPYPGKVISAEDAIPPNLGMHISPTVAERLANDHLVWHEGQKITHPHCPLCKPDSSEKKEPREIGNVSGGTHKRAKRPATISITGKGKIYLGSFENDSEASFAYNCAIVLLNDDRIQKPVGKAPITKERQEAILNQVIYSLDKV